MKILFFFIGCCVGSLLNVICWRTLNNENFIVGRSHCEKCGKFLKFYEMIPVISYLFQKGRCRYCRNKIKMIYPVTEAICGLTTLYMYGNGGIMTLPFFYTLILISLFDMERMEFPVLLLLLLLITGVCNMNVDDFERNIICSFVLFISSIAVRKWLGEGDGMIFTIICLCHGLVFTTHVMLFASLSGILFILLKKRESVHERIPFCPFITIGYLMCFVMGK